MDILEKSHTQVDFHIVSIHVTISDYYNVCIYFIPTIIYNFVYTSRVVQQPIVPARDDSTTTKTAEIAADIERLSYLVI
jgi:hypothetical protein